MNFLISGFTKTQELISDAIHDMIPEIVHAGVSAGLQDERIQTIISGAGLIAVGIGTIQASGMPKTIYSWFSQKEIAPAVREENSLSKRVCFWGGALIGMAGIYIGVSIAAMGVLQFMECLYPYENLGPDAKPEFNCISQNPHAKTTDIWGFQKWIPKCTYPFPCSSTGPTPDCCICTNSDQDLNDADCVYKPHEVCWNYPCLPGAHNIFSELRGDRAFEIKKLRRDPETFKILLSLEKDLYWNQSEIAKHRAKIIDKKDKDQAETLADEIYSRFLDKYRPFGIDENNAILQLSQEECLRKGLLAGNGRMELSSYNKDFDDRVMLRAMVCDGDENNFGGYIPKGLVKRHELMHVQEYAYEFSFTKQGQELFTVIRDLIDLDQIYKQIHHLDLAFEVDYGRQIPKISHVLVYGGLESLNNGCEGVQIPLGKFINFYRELEQMNQNLAETLTSRESIEFLTSCKSDSIA